MAKFYVSESFRVPVKIYEKGGRTIDNDQLKEIAKTESEFGDFLNRNGVYIFSIRAGRGCKPWYVGKSEKSNFLGEAFNTRNRTALNDLIMSRKGTLEISFVTQEYVRGKPNARNIGEIEYLLIGHAAERNSDLLNVQNKYQSDDFSIKNVYNDGKKAKTKAEKEFRALMGL